MIGRTALIVVIATSVCCRDDGQGDTSPREAARGQAASSNGSRAASRSPDQQGGMSTKELSATIQEKLVDVLRKGHGQLSREQQEELKKHILSQVAPQLSEQRQKMIAKLSGHLPTDPTKEGDAEVRRASLKTIVRTARQLEAAGDVDEAERHYRNAVALAKRSDKDRSELPTYLETLAEFLYKQRRYDDVRPLLEESLKLRQAVGHAKPRIARTLWYLADVLRTQRRYSEAEQHLTQAAAICDEFQQHNLAADVIAWLASVQAHLGRHDEARESFNQAVRITDRPDFMGNRNRVYREALRYYESQGLHTQVSRVKERRSNVAMYRFPGSVLLPEEREALPSSGGRHAQIRRSDGATRLESLRLEFQGAAAAWDAEQSRAEAMARYANRTTTGRNTAILRPSGPDSRVQQEYLRAKYAYEMESRRRP